MASQRTSGEKGAADLTGKSDAATGWSLSMPPHTPAEWLRRWVVSALQRRGGRIGELAEYTSSSSSRPNLVVPVSMAGAEVSWIIGSTTSSL